MAQREAGKARKRAVKGSDPVRLPVGGGGKSAGGGKSGAGDKTGRVPQSQQISQLEQERDALKAELEAAKARIAELERSRELIVNRIDWVIDSLHNLIEE